MPAPRAKPRLFIIAGPNGAGKTTFAGRFLPHYAHCLEFINADLIAAGLSPFAPQTAAFRAGRLVLEQIQTHRARRCDFSRRFDKGVQNLFRLYRPLLDSWTIFDNSTETPQIVALEEAGKITIANPDVFARLRRTTGVE